MALPCARLAEARDGADERGERARAAEVGRVADPGQQAGGGLGPDARDRGEQLADVVGAEQALDVALDGAEAAAPEIEVLAGVADLQAIGLAVMLADRGRRGGSERLGHLLTDPVTPVIPPVGQPADRNAAEGPGGRVLAQDGRGQRAPEVRDGARELGEAEVDQAVELADPVAEVLDEAIAEVDEFPQFLEGAVRQGRRLRPLLPAEVREAEGIDGVRRRPPPCLLGEAWGRKGFTRAMAKPRAARVAKRFRQ